MCPSPTNAGNELSKSDWFQTQVLIDAAGTPRGSYGMNWRSVDSRYANSNPRGLRSVIPRLAPYGAPRFMTAREVVLISKKVAVGPV